MNNRSKLRRRLNQVAWDHAGSMRRMVAAREAGVLRRSLKDAAVRPAHVPSVVGSHLPPNTGVVA